LMARRQRLDGRPIPAHPYRDTAVAYGVLSVLLVVVAWLTGGDAFRAILVAVAFFVVATAWSWWKFRGRIREREAAETPASLMGRDGDQAGLNGKGSARR
jgi:membrane protein implicated in regulation of membrane protease activity